MFTRRVLFAFFILGFSSPSLVSTASADDAGLASLELSKRSFLLGREYFVLRSGSAQMIVQADRADVGPAVSYLLFNAENAFQSKRKEGAFNFVPQQGFASSALEVELGGYAFTALGHRTTTRWVKRDGVPHVEAVWWAGGVRVTERIAPLGQAGAFLRSVELAADHLAGKDAVTLSFSLPPGDCRREDAVLYQGGRGVVVALAVVGDHSTETLEKATPKNAIQEEQSCIRVGPISLTPGSTAVVDTILVVQIPEGTVQEAVALAAKLASSGGGPELAASRQWWTRTSSIITKDRTVQALFDKARFGLPGMIAENGTMNAGIFEYGAQWVRDTSNTALGAIHCGQFELARGALQLMLTTMINQEGATMIQSTFHTPDREQFDQMGELLHVLKSYRDWTGDDSLIREHRERLVAMIERPLSKQFRDETGMVHNRREFWERTLTDAYELAYQTYVIQGLRDAVDLAPALGAEDRMARWQAEADRILQAMLSNPSRALVHEDRLIKRRKVSGEVAILAKVRSVKRDAPATTEKHRRLMPDATQALPIMLGLVDGRSELARRTLDELDELWNTRWSDGGHDRYHTSSQADQPGPWPFATCFIMRAQHESGLYKRSRRCLEWLNTVQGGRAGAWFEGIPSIRSNQRGCGVLPWTSAEIAVFVVRHWLGVRFEGDQLVLRPALFPGSAAVVSDLRFRTSRLRLEIDGSGPVQSATVTGVEIKPDGDGWVRLPRDFAGGTVVVRTVGSDSP